MIDGTQMLRRYLAGLRRLTGCKAATLFVPSSLSGLSAPILLHEGSTPPLGELADETAAARTAARLGSATRRDGEIQNRHHVVAGGEAGTVLLPLPGGEASSPRYRSGPATRAAAQRPAAWLGLRLPDSGDAPKLPEWLEEWLWALGGAIAAHSAQVAAALRDPLTGLPDRVGLQALLSEELERARIEHSPLALLLLNPDDFAAVNERWGREAGDRIIREIAVRLRAALRDSVHLARYGGVIFAAVAPDTSLATARKLADDALAALSRQPFGDGGARVRFSIGVAVTQENPERQPVDPLELLQRADRALSAAKRAGGARVADWTQPIRSDAPGLDRLSGIFTGNMAKDYRNMALLTGALEVISQHVDYSRLVHALVERLWIVLRPRRVALFDRSSGELRLVRGLTRQGGGTQSRLETIELGPDEAPVVERAASASEPCEIGDGEGPAAWILPLTSGGSDHGCLLLEPREEAVAFDASDLFFLRALAAQISVAIDRAHLAAGESERRQRESQELRAELNELRQALHQAKLVHRSAEMDEVLASVRRVAPTDATVLITGESGTGKELLARTLHELSPRRERPMVVVDCGAIAPSLIENELFGHERGAYTGAAGRRAGRLQEAAGGTVLLDEVSELPLEIQSRLLRFVQEKLLAPVGSSRSRRVDARIVAATHRDLAREVSEGRFREDLYHRLNVVRIEVPALRRRPDDILHLARHFIEVYSLQYQKQPRRLDPEAEELLLSYPWPGNVRELQNRLMQAVILSEGDEIGSEALKLPPVADRGGAPAAGEAPAARDEEPIPPHRDASDRLRAALAHQVDFALAAGNHGAFPLGRWLGEDVILEANEAGREIARQGARIVGIPETTFRRRLRKATDNATAGFVPRTPHWDLVRSAVSQLVQELGGSGVDLISRSERLLLDEILERLPDEPGIGAKLLGVTPPTYRNRVAQILTR